MNEIKLQTYADTDIEKARAKRRVNRDDWESIQCMLCGVMVDSDQMKRKHQQYCSPTCRKSANSAAQWERKKKFNTDVAGKGTPAVAVRELRQH